MLGRLPLKKKIIDKSAVELFATKGLARTSIKDIAKAAGVTEGALYRHYPSKNQMAWELFCTEIQRFTLGLQEIISEKEITIEEKFERCIYYLYRYYSENSIEFTFILLTQHGFPGEKLLDEKTNPNDIVINAVSELFSDQNDVNLSVLSGMIMGAILQPIVMHNYNRLDQPIMNYVDDVIMVCKRIIAF